MNALSPSHLRQRIKREQGKVLHNSDNNRNNQSPLVVPNEYGSNLNILKVGLDGFHQF